MKRVLPSLIAIPLAAVLGLFLYGWWRERGFVGDHPMPGKQYGNPPSAHAIDALGAEPAVVFIHGNPGTCLDFTPVMAKLSPKLHSYAFDRPGYGWSPRPAPEMSPSDQARFLHDAVKHQGLVKPIVAGFSFGGPVALAYALEYPNELSALVLIAAVGSPDEKHELSPAQSKLLEPWGPLVAWSLGPIVGPDAVSEGYVDAFFPKPPDPEVVERGRYQFTRPPTLLASARDWRVLETELPKLAARYGELKLPVEILSANQDRIVSPKHAAYLSAHLTNAHPHRVDVEQAGHQLMSTHPQAVADAVMRAAARVGR
jgi:pimeloyl-ACP methyl ester carboxylesterase